MNRIQRKNNPTSNPKPIPSRENFTLFGIPEQSWLNIAVAVMSALTLLLLIFISVKLRGVLRKHNKILDLVTNVDLVTIIPLLTSSTALNNLFTNLVDGMAPKNTKFSLF